MGGWDNYSTSVRQLGWKVNCFCTGGNRSLRPYTSTPRWEGGSNALLRMPLPPCTVRELVWSGKTCRRHAFSLGGLQLGEVSGRTRGSATECQEESRNDIWILWFEKDPSYRAGLCRCLRSSGRAQGAPTCSSLILDSLSDPGTVYCAACLLHFEGMLLVSDTWAELVRRLYRGFRWGVFSALMARRVN